MNQSISLQNICSVTHTHNYFSGYVAWCLPCFQQTRNLMVFRHFQGGYRLVQINWKTPRIVKAGYICYTCIISAFLYCLSLAFSSRFKETLTLDLKTSLFFLICLGNQAFLVALTYFELPVSFRLNSWKLIVRECLGHQCSVIAETLKTEDEDSEMTLEFDKFWDQYRSLVFECQDTCQFLSVNSLTKLN